MEQTTNWLKHSTRIITFLSAKTGLWFNAKSPLKLLDLDLIFLSRELVFQGTISKAKHRRNVFMAGTEYFDATAQLGSITKTGPGRRRKSSLQLNHATTYLSSACQYHAEITQSQTFSALIRLSTTTHTLLTSNTSGISWTYLWTFLFHLSYLSSRMYSHTVGRPA